MANQMNQSAQAAQHAQFFSARGPNILLLAPQPGGGGGVFKGAASATGHLTPAAQAALEDAWEAQAFAEDLQASSGAAHQWPPRSYACTFCAREFRTAQALGGHMNVHRRERAQANQLAMLRQAATFTQLAAIGPPVQASPEQLQAGGPLACVITRFQEAKPALLPHVDASHHPEMGRATLKLAAAPSAALGNDSGFPTLQPAPDAGATSEYLDRASSPAQSASNSPLSSPRPSQCSSTSTDKKKSRKRSHQAAADAYGDILTAKPNSVAASFMQILQPNRADGPATAHARGLVLPLRAFQPYNHSSVADDPSAAGVKRMREWARGSSSPDKYCGDTECEDTGLDLELRL